MNLMMEGWVEVILQYDFTTQYLPGNLNWFADALSRSREPEIISVGARVSKVASMTHMDSEETAKWEARKRGQILPSESLKTQLMEQTHALGHFGTETMFRRIWNRLLVANHEKSAQEDDTAVSTLLEV